jgi:hypothetical protein
MIGAFKAAMSYFARKDGVGQASAAGKLDVKQGLHLLVSMSIT